MKTIMKLLITAFLAVSVAGHAGFVTKQAKEQYASYIAGMTDAQQEVFFSGDARSRLSRID